MKRNWQIRKYQVSRRNLLKKLGFDKEKLPSLIGVGYCVSQSPIYKNVEIPDALNRTLLITDVMLHCCYEQGKKPRRSKSRVFLLCKQCDKFIPFGRFFQHLDRKDHAKEFTPDYEKDLSCTV